MFSYNKMSTSTKMSNKRLAIPLLGALLWVLFIHTGTYAAANFLPPPITGHGRRPSNYIYKQHEHSHYRRIPGVKVTPHDVNSSITFIQHITNMSKGFEHNLAAAKIELKPETPSHGMYVSFGPEPEAIDRGKDGMIAFMASRQVLTSVCDETSDDCLNYISNFKFHQTPLANSCDTVFKKCSKQDSLNPYRVINGACNHVTNGAIGESFTGYTRLLSAVYSDRFWTPRRAYDKSPMPSARLISTTLNLRDGIPQIHDSITLAAMQWSQFIDHDLSQRAISITYHTEKKIQCCEETGKMLSPRYVHPACFPVLLPSTDESYVKDGIFCMSYVRSMPSVRSDCSLGPTEQLNQATHYLDGSQIYGTTFKKSSSLRQFTEGKLKMSVDNGYSYLPLSSTPSDCQAHTKHCFKSGDSRVNFQPQLTVMHTLWYREHNRIAEELGKLNTQWDDETIFQETRRIVIAEMQHITYNEWAPTVLNRNYVKRIEKFTEYDENLNPTVSNSFGAAAMRSFLSLAHSNISLYGPKRDYISSLKLHKYYHHPDIIESENTFDGLINGLAYQLSEKYDILFTEDLTKYLYIAKNIGYDLLTLNIQNGRDHGLAPYVAYRNLCGLRKVRRFQDLSDFISSKNIKLLSSVYKHPNDIDLIVGGLLEKPDGDSMVGPTFSCILADQLLRTRRGDRFFFTNHYQPKPFTHEQLSEIKNITLARIFCDNSNEANWMQPNVFKFPSDENPLLNCKNEKIPRLNLDAWKESSDSQR